MIDTHTSHPYLRYKSHNERQQKHMDRLAQGYECVGDTSFDVDLMTFTIVRRSVKVLYLEQGRGNKTKVYYTAGGRDDGVAGQRRKLG